ncbi:hypothetical protein COV93_05040 [Candidatus Woesearchaeota archaeon CG11_big_fil_rev_8_21_14_0_20_43_8]|nr:MAG: hypothetical protein COV93_05040 [Candidatus Woesearchaeota archaeon CG11_big_fil_rev_8_21_14_0_20_43_8]
MLIFLSIGLAVVPTVSYDRPISQYDGAYYYLIAKAWVQGGYDSSVNKNVNIVNNVSDYPPGLIAFYKVIFQYFDADLLVINGFFIAALFVLGNIFMYYAILTLTENRLISLLVLAYSVLNIRAYFMIFGGMQPTIAGISIGFAAFFFFCRWLKERKKSDMILVIIINCIIAIIHSATLLFILILELSLFFGTIADKKMKIKLPDIRIRFKKISPSDLKGLLYVIIPVFVFILLMRFFITDLLSINVFLKEWIKTSLLTHDAGGYQSIWKVSFLMEGPIVYVLSMIGIVHILFKKDLKVFFLIIGGFLFILSRHILFPKPSWPIHFIYNFYPIWTILVALSAAYIFYWVLKDKNIRWIGMTILIVSLLIQIIKLGIFFSMLGPAITTDEVSAIEYLKENLGDESILFYNNIDEFGWRAFIWVPVLSEPKASLQTRDIDIFRDNIADYDLLYIGDNTKLDKDENELLSDKTKVYEKGHVTIYK